MNVTVLLFAGAKSIVGEPQLDVELPSGATVGDLLATLALTNDQLTPLLGSCRIAVDQEYVDSECLISPGAQCALIPPVSGG